MMARAETLLLGGGEPVGQTALGQEFNMGGFRLAAIGPDDRAFLRVEVEQGGFRAGSHGAD